MPYLTLNVKSTYSAFLVPLEIYFRSRIILINFRSKIILMKKDLRLYQDREWSKLSLKTPQRKKSCVDDTGLKFFKNSLDIE